MSPLSYESVWRWSLYLTLRHGVDVPEAVYEDSCDAILRGEEPPNDGWQEELAQRAEREAMVEEECETWQWGDLEDRIPWDEGER